VDAARVGTLASLDQILAPEIRRNQLAGPITRVIGPKSPILPVQEHRKSDLADRPYASPDAPPQAVNLAPAAQVLFVR
jgi:hypothetical protein